MRKAEYLKLPLRHRLRPLNERLWRAALRESDLAMEGKAPSYQRVTLPLPADKDEIRTVRKALAATQRGFAVLMGVSVETVKAWEAGKRSPEGPATKLIRLLRKDRRLAEALAGL